jgi:hypothetical protein
MAHIGLQRQAEAHIALELGSHLCSISDRSPAFRDEHGFRGVQGHHRLDLSGVNRSINDGNALGLCREWEICLRTNTDDRLALDPLGPVEGGGGVIEG